MTELTPALVFEIVFRTLEVCLPALAIAVAIGLPVGIVLGRGRFRGRGIVVSAVNAGMGTPPVVVGLAGALLSAVGAALLDGGPLATSSK